jgi:hypothetical protein
VLAEALPRATKFMIEARIVPWLCHFHTYSCRSALPCFVKRLPGVRSTSACSLSAVFVSSSHELRSDPQLTRAPIAPPWENLRKSLKLLVGPTGFIISMAASRRVAGTACAVLAGRTPAMQPVVLPQLTEMIAGKPPLRRLLVFVGSSGRFVQARLGMPASRSPSM